MLFYYFTEIYHVQSFLTIVIGDSFFFKFFINFSQIKIKNYLLKKKKKFNLKISKKVN